MASKIYVALFGLIILAGLFFLGYYFGANAGSGKLDLARNELADARSALDAARSGNADLERRLGEIAGLARASAGTVDSAIVESGKITDSAKRIKLLVGAIRSAIDSLRIILEKGTSTEIP